jgi:hypothetical protein
VYVKVQCQGGGGGGDGGVIVGRCENYARVVGRFDWPEPLVGDDQVHHFINTTIGQKEQSIRFWFHFGL